MPDALPIEMPFPIRGIDRSGPVAKQPEGTTTHAQNVRVFAGKNQRAGGGRRPGLPKMFSGKAGEESARQILGLEVLNKAAANPELGSGFYDTVTEDWQTSIVRTASGEVSDLCTDPTVAGSRQDLAVFAVPTATGYTTSYTGYQVRRNDTSITSGAGSALGKDGPVTDGGLVLDFVAASGHPGVAVLFRTNNDVSCTLFASGRARNSAGGTGAVGEPVNLGPFIRGSGQLHQFIAAALVYDGASDQVKLSIIKLDGATRTVLASSDAATLSGTAWNSTTWSRPGPTIRIYEGASNVIVAKCTWAAEGIGDLVASITTADFAGNSRGGIAAPMPIPGPTDVAQRWYVKSITYTKIVPKAAAVRQVLTRFSKQFPEPLRYWLPADWTGYGLTTAGVLTTFSGSAASAPGTAQPYIDAATFFLRGNTAANASSFVLPTTTPTQRLQVEVRGRRDSAAGDDSSGNNEDIPGVVLRATADRRSMILIEVKHGAKAFPDTTYIGYSRQHHFDEIRLVGVADGARYVLATHTPADTPIPPFRSDVHQRFEDDGAATVAAAVIRWKVNGMTQMSWTLGSLTGWAAFAAAISAGDLAEMNTSLLCGLAFRGNDAPPPTFLAFGGRLVDATDETDLTQTVAEHNSTIAVFTSGHVDIGTTDGGLLNRCSGVGIRNPAISTAVFANQIYAVDGSVRKIVNPTAFSVVDWNAGADLGTMPSKCRLLCEWRRRAVLGRSDEDAAAWYMSRLNNWVDWNYNADPIETAATIGTNAVSGQPADPLTALIPYSNDVLVMGGTTGINAMVGDPQTGGSIQNITRKTGIIGSRAWCIDGEGNLWFVGNEGLFKLRPAPGEVPINVSRGRMGDLLEDIDATAVLVQMVYSPPEQCIYIFLSAADKGTACTHVVYSVPDDAFTEDTYDVGGTKPGMNPWAVAVAGSSDPRERHVMLGGYDGWVRRFDFNTHYDDDDAGTLAIDASVDMFAPWGPLRNVTMVRNVQILLAVGSDPVTAYWFGADSPEAVAAQTPGSERTSWTVAGGGYRRGQSIRQTAAAHKLRLRQNTVGQDFAVEAITALIEQRGRRR